MSAQSKNSSGKGPHHESQSDRWLKYGSNVVLSVVLVIAMGIGLIWLAQRYPDRGDMTTGGSLSLKPQSVSVVNALKQHITLVSLYARPDNEPEQAAQAQRVSDLLDEYEYKSRSGKIDIRVIDPAKEKDKLEALHQEFITRYGGEIKNYKEYLDDWKIKVDQLTKLTSNEVKAISPLADDSGTGEESGASEFARTVYELDQELAAARKAVDKELAKKHPDFKAATVTARKQMEQLLQLASAVVTQAPAIMSNPQAPAPFKAYLSKSLGNFQEIKKIAGALQDKAGKLGELKIDKLEQALTIENPILVLGESDWKIIPKTQVWPEESDVRAWNGTGKPQPRFAGEQQITTAIFTLENPKKQKVCFVRPGGGPLTGPASLQLTQGGLRQVPAGPFALFAARLREYNFDVTEKDISGQWAMQAQMQRMRTQPEPSDEEIKDAIWVVIDFPAGDSEGPPPPSELAPRLKAHLDQGSSALLIGLQNGDKMAFLKEWGVELHTEALAVHGTIKLTDAAMHDPFEEAMAQPAVFDCRSYGDHPIVKPIQNLDCAIAGSIVVKTHDVKGFSVTPLLPLSENTGGVNTWGETSREQLEQGTPEFNPDKGDIASPIYGGAAVEKQGGARLVVFGSAIPQNGLLRLFDPKLRQRDIYVNRFPGNLELSTNSMFWLAHLDSMISISPAAMDVSRISDMSPGWLHFWRMAMLLILPGMVLIGGVLMFIARRN